MQVYFGNGKMVDTERLTEKELRFFFAAINQEMANRLSDTERHNLKYYLQLDKPGNVVCQSLINVEKAFLYALDVVCEEQTEAVITEPIVEVVTETVKQVKSKKSSSKTTKK
jgi:hypothetical protein